MRFFLFLFSLPAFGAVTNLTVVGATQTQILISFTATDPASATIEASVESDYMPLALDLDTTYYSGANAATRTGNLVNGRQVFAVIGKQGPNAVAAALDGVTRSRALRVDTTYYIRVTQGDSATVTARTANLMMGDARGEPLAVAEPFKYKQVTTNPRMVSDYNDPYTGALVKNIPELYGWVVLASTAKTNIHADCNVTMTGGDSSCKFTDATGTNWTPTSSTLTAAIRAEDANYAEYSGITQDIMILRLGSPRLGLSSDLSRHKLSFQNIFIRGQTSTTAGDGEEIETCLSMDAHLSSPPTCDSPWITTNLTTSDSTIRICADSPCTTADNPGDWMTYNDPSYRFKLSRSRVYNEAGSLDVVKFVGDDAEADCNRIQVGEAIYVYKASVSTGYNLTAASKNCGASPPQYTAAETTVDITHLGTRGVGFYTFDGINSQHYALLLRKKSTTSGSTIKIDYALWRAAWGHAGYLNDKSGGMGQKCQTVANASGYYLCVTPQGILGVKPNATQDGYDFKFYGTAWIDAKNRPGGTGLAEGYTLCAGELQGWFAWDLTTAGVFYCGFPSTYPNPYKGGAVDNRRVLSKVTMSMADVSAPDPDNGAGGLAPGIGITAIKQLTPCLNSCLDESDDYTPFGQAMKFSAAWTDPLVPFDTRWPGPGCGFMIDANTLGCGSQMANQDALSWNFAFDLGNGEAIGSGFVGTRGGNTQQIFAGMHYGNNAVSRFCGVHTGNNAVRATTQPFIAGEVAASQPCIFYSQTTNTLNSCAANPTSGVGTCTRCDTLASGGNLTLDGYDYSGDQRICSLMQLTSTWPNPGASTLWTGSQHPLWAAGQPVNASGCGGNTLFYYDQNWRRGDYMYRNGEVFRILQVNSATEYVVVRGFGRVNGGTDGLSHSIGSNIATLCYNRRYNTPTTALNTEIAGSVVWYPILDPVGGMNSTYTFLSDFHNHALYGMNYASWDKWKVGVFDFDDYTTFKSIFASKNFAEMSIPNSFRFAGKSAFLVGNSVEYHPGVQQVLNTEPTWFHDVNPRLFHVGATGSPTATQVSGKTNIFKLGGTATTYISPKHFDIDGFSDRSPMIFTDTLADDSTGRGKMCYAAVADDCFSGSDAGGFYFSNELYDTSYNGSGSQKVCVEAEFGGVGIDACIGNVGFVGVTQTRFPSTNGQTTRNGKFTRVVKREGMLYRPAATINNMTDPLGFGLMLRDMPQYVVLPSFRSMRADGFDTFRSIPATVSSVPAGTSTALVQFGYDGGFVCSRNRTNTCYAESAALNEATPFMWDHETLTGVSCGSGCTITIPAIANRMLYWRMVYRNSGGSIIATGATNVQAVN